MIICDCKHNPSIKSIMKIRSGDLSADDFESPITEVVLGQDRDLIHVSVDLKWLFKTLTDQKKWNELTFSITSAFLRFFGIVDNEKIFVKNAISVLSSIRNINKHSTLKLFRGNLQQAEIYSSSVNKLIILYLEDVSVSASFSTSPKCLAYRVALANTELGNFINDNFVFVCTSIDHLPTKRLALQLGLNTSEPVFAVLNTRMIDHITGDEAGEGEVKTINISSASTVSQGQGPGPGQCSLEVATYLHLGLLQDITSANIHKFLERSLEVYGRSDKTKNSIPRFF